METNQKISYNYLLTELLPLTNEYAQLAHKANQLFERMVEEMSLEDLKLLQGTAQVAQSNQGSNLDNLVATVIFKLVSKAVVKQPDFEKPALDRLRNMSTSADLEEKSIESLKLKLKKAEARLDVERANFTNALNTQNQDLIWPALEQKQMVMLEFLELKSILHVKCLNQITEEDKKVDLNPTTNHARDDLMNRLYSGLVEK